MDKSKVGKIDISALNVPPEKYEYETARYFANRGYDVVFVRPRYINGFHNPDFEMCGKIWETKSPNGKSKMPTIRTLLAITRDGRLLTVKGKFGNI